MGTQANLVAARYMGKEAKRQHLKAIDFTLGLLRRLKTMGKGLPGADLQTVGKRLVDLRRMSQVSGFQLDTLLENKKLISGKGTTVLKLLEQDESRLIPSEKNLAGFVKPFPNKVVAAQDAQARKWATQIAAKTNVPLPDIEERAKHDYEFFQICFDIASKDFLKAQRELGSLIAPIAKGKFEGQAKAAPNTFKKQTREGEGQRSFLSFKDLARCRVISATVENMAEVAVAAQSKLKVLQKKNFYLAGSGYNAIHYFFQGAAICEVQVKTTVNHLEAALGHDLIYAKEKAIIQLSGPEKAMVARVIDVSTQLSMREWSETFDVALKLAMQHVSSAERVAFKASLAS